MSCIFNIKKEDRHCQYCTATICDERQQKPIETHLTNKINKMSNYCYKIDDKCVRISPNIFVVKNQNGFNKALYEFKKPDEGGEYGDGNNYSKEELREMVDNYPKQYPCVINLNFIWEVSRIEVDVIADSEIEILNTYLNQYKKEKEVVGIEEFIEKWKNYKNCGQIIIFKKFTKQDVDDLRLLSELAFDGACISNEDEKLIKRVSALADKIEVMI